ncbi:MAG: NUDIX domain-containing protein [Pseudomonadota bacterium]
MGAKKIKKMSAGVVPVRFTPEGTRVLMLRAYRHWDFPKGGIEAGEQPLDAAVREVQEETGITDLSFDWQWQYLDTGPYGHGKVSRYFVATTRERRVVLGINPELGRPEHHEYRWFSFRSAERLLTPRVAAVLHWAAELIGEDMDAARRARSPTSP